MWKVAIIALAASLLTSGQGLYSIQGTLTDSTVNKPLADWEITVYDSNGPLDSEPVVAKMKTDAQGKFRFSIPNAGYFYVRAEYRYSHDMRTRSTRVQLSPGKPLAEVAIALQRSGQIRGRLVDEETGNPLTNFYAHAVRVTAKDGRFTTTFENHISSDANGSFRLQLPPGTFAVETQPQGAPPFSGAVEDRDGIEVNYHHALYPATSAGMSPVTVTSETDVDLGTIRVRKQRLYHVRVEPDPKFCPPGSQVSGVDSTLLVLERQPLRGVPCGRFALPPRPPGDYELDVQVGKTLAETYSVPSTNRAVIRYSVTNADVVLPLTPTAAPLRGRVKSDGGPTSVSFTAVEPIIAGSEARPQQTAADGSFAYQNVQPRLLKARVDGLGAQYFVRQVRYRGNVAPGGVFFFSGGGEVEIEIGQGASSLSGAVNRGGVIVPDADVVLVPAPNAYAPIQHVTADRDGRYTIANVPPGEYKLFAVPASAREPAQQPDAWQRLLKQAATIVLQPGTSRNAAVTVRDP